MGGGGRADGVTGLLAAGAGRSRMGRGGRSGRDRAHRRRTAVPRHADQLASDRSGDRIRRRRQRGQGVLRPRAVRGGGGAGRCGDRCAAAVRVRARRRFPRVRGAGRRPARHPAGRSEQRRDDALHVRDDRPAEGRQTGADGHRPRRRRRADDVPARHVRHPAGTSRRWRGAGPSGHLAELPHGRHPVRRHRPAHGPHTRLHGRVGRRGNAAADPGTPRHQHPHGADAFQAAAGAARGRPRTVRRVEHAARHPRGGAVPGADQAADARLVGRLRLGVLRGDGGRRDDRQPRRLARPPPARSGTRGRTASC